jgi:hemolysin III
LQDNENLNSMADSQSVGAARRANRIILTVTLVFSIIALMLLVRFAAETSNQRSGGAAIVYGASLVACSLCSFLYHTLERSPRRAVLRYLDHAAIFLLIAGTYTPFAADGLPGPLGVGLLDWVWGLALVGILLKLRLREAYDRAFVALYVGLGWLFVSAIREVIDTTPPLALCLLVVGGLAYTAGAFVYARDRGCWTAPVWHGCVLAGAVTHFLAVLAVLLTAPGA